MPILKLFLGKNLFTREIKFRKFSAVNFEVFCDYFFIYFWLTKIVALTPIVTHVSCHLILKIFVNSVEVKLGRNIKGLSAD